jgi:hypothetical protein
MMQERKHGIEEDLKGIHAVAMVLIIDDAGNGS